MELNGRRVLVIGLGKTGVAVTRFLARRGARVAVTDQKPAVELQEAFARIGKQGISVETADYGDTRCLSGIDCVVPSPGVLPANALLVESLKRGIPVISEIELSGRFIQRPIIAITGTNGKTTTTRLAGAMLGEWGKRVFVGGNIGNPLIECVENQGDYDFLVAEISSFQLQWARSFHPHVAVLLNVTPDHMDYHESLNEYRSMKERIFENQDASDAAVLNADEALSEALSKRLRSTVVFFSSSARLNRGGCLAEGAILYTGPDGTEEKYPLDEFTLPGRHNLENVMAALAAARWCGCPPQAILAGMGKFKGLPHRLEFAGGLDGVRYYNDSKGTNIDAVVRALESFSGPVVLLMGGRFKGGDGAVLSRLINEKVKKLVLFGEARHALQDLFGDDTATHMYERFDDAVRAAFDAAVPGEVVLLSPGCSSFDEFRNYEERGDRFKVLLARFLEQESRCRDESRH